LVLLASVAIVAFMAGTSQAVVLINHPDQYFFGGSDTNMKMTNFENLIKGPGNVAPGFEVGDRLRGIAEITSSNSPGGGNLTQRVANGFELTIFFDTLITRADVYSGSKALVEFAPYAGFEATYGAGAMAAFFYDTTPDFSGIAATQAASEATATDGALYMTVGAKGDWGDVDGDGVGWYWGGTGELTPSVASFAASLALLTNNTGIPFADFPGITQAPGLSPGDATDHVGAPYVDASGLPYFTNELALIGILNEFGLQGNTVLNPEGPAFAGATSPWLVKSQDPIRTNVIPEPSSLLVFAGLFGCMAFGVYRRKRQA